MSDLTSKAIKQAFSELLCERPLNEITVKDIAARCGINRNSFYYHYQDLPALIEEIVLEEADRTIEQFPTVESIVDCFDAMIAFSSNQKMPIMHIYRSVNRDVFEQNLMKISEYFVRSYVERTLVDENIEKEDMKAIIDYYKCVCFGLVIDWLNSGMKEERAQEIRRIFRLKKDMAKDISNMLRNQI